MSLELVNVQIVKEMQLKIDPRIPDIGLAEDGSYYAVDGTSAEKIPTIVAIDKIAASFEIMAPILVLARAAVAHVE